MNARDENGGRGDDGARTDERVRVEVLPDPAELATRACEVITQTLRQAIASRGRALFALAGGSTPKATYRALSTQPEALDWSRVHVVWGDERVVPPDHEQSNVGMARSVLLGPLHVPEENLHAPRTALGAQDAALAYEITLRELDPEAAVPRLDLVLLGLGGDGHTASLFPDGEELEAGESKLVVTSTAPSAPRERISITLPLIAAARRVVFLVSGESKRDALRRVLEGDRSLPAARVRLEDGELLWLIDEDARPRR